MPHLYSHINVHIRPRSIMVMYSKPAYTTYETAQSTYKLVVVLDDHGEANGEVYHDDGETQWTEKAPGTTAIFSVAGRKLTSQIIPGKYAFEQKLAEIIILGVAQKPSHSRVGTTSVHFSYNSTVWLTTLMSQGC